MSSRRSSWRRMLLLIGLAVATVGAACAPGTPGPTGSQEVAVSVTGSRTWSAQGEVDPRFTTTRNSDGLLRSLAGTVNLATAEGDQLTITADVNLLGTADYGSIVVTNNTVGRSANGIVAGTPAVAVDEAADGSWSLSIGADWGSFYQGKWIPGRIDLTVRQSPADVDPGTPVELTVMSGTSASVNIPAPGAALVSSASVAEGDTSGLSVTVVGSSSGGPPQPVTTLAVTAPVGTPAASRRLTVVSTGCTVVPGDGGCPLGSEWESTTTVDLTTVVPSTTPPDGLLSPDPSRWVDNGDGTFTLPDTVEVMSDPGFTRQQIADIATALDFTVVGASDFLHVYWFGVDDVAAAVVELAGTPGIRWARPLIGQVPALNAVPPEYGQFDELKRWQYDQTGLDEVWATTPGSAEVHLGVIDSGIDAKNSDLVSNTASIDAALGSTVSYEVLSAVDHGTTVAGVMCGAAGNDGIVGVHPSCRLHGLDQSTVVAAVGDRLEAYADWLMALDAVRVVNMSFGLEGPEPDPRIGCDAAAASPESRDLFKTFVDAFPDTLFVIAAGNCPNRTFQDAIPSSSDTHPAPNVIGIGATVRSTDGSGRLANYSSRGATLAAPGGSSIPGEAELWAAGHTNCVEATQTCRPQPRFTRGTSFAAPFVSGLAGLMLSVAPDLSTSGLVECLVNNDSSRAIFGVEGDPLGGGVNEREISATAAMECAGWEPPPPPPPPTLTSPKVAAGGNHTCAILADETVTCWGWNVNGQLGNGTNDNSNVPTSVEDLTNVSRIAAGSGHTCAISEGDVWCWGDNFGGQLGDGSYDSSNVPKKVGGISNATEVAAGVAHTCALVEGGGAKCWGNNARGQLGDGSTSERLTPEDVDGDDLGTKLVAGGRHTCSYTPGGVGLRCWGENTFGQIGDGSNEDRTEPVSVSGGIVFTQASAGTFFTCAVPGSGSDSGGTVCWGRNQFGQLGDGTTDDRNSPGSGIDGLENVGMVSAGGSLTCATLAGRVKCWGRNQNGQLGNDTPTDSRTPVDVLVISNARAVSSGSGHACATLADNTVWCWGAGNVGQLGNETNTNSSIPVRVKDLTLE